MDRIPFTGTAVRWSHSAPRLGLLLVVITCLIAGFAVPSRQASAMPDSLYEPTSTAGTAAPAEGRVNFFMHHDSELDRFTQNPTAAQQQWIRQRYRRMTTYSTYFDSRTTWYQGAWLYADAYAIYNPSDTANQHPEWILRDSADGARLYIPYDCAGGTCPQFAADIGDPAWRAFWIERVRAKLAAYPYQGIFVDDVNMALKVSDGFSTAVAPYDRRTGAAMTIDDWRNYMATFMEEIRRAFPAHEIVHNQVYFFAPIADPAVRRAVAAADYIQIERGFNDMNIPGGSGAFGFETLLDYIDEYHNAGKQVITYVVDTWGREYGLATYLLVSNGRDLLGNKSGGLPDNWWSGYDVDLGPARSGRHTWSGLFRRDFENGLVLVNQPGQPARTVALDGRYVDLSGQTRTTVTLNAREGVVLMRQP